jgi:bifunctional DNA-binding transcriptional regulator/antitoxin component of YhaV-PrlF toxin-antitoxin module
LLSSYSSIELNLYRRLYFRLLVNPALRVVLKVRRKGVVVLPKALREAAGIEEESEVVAEAGPGAVVLKPLKLREVDVDPKLVEEILREEGEAEARKLHDLLQ